MQSTIRRRFLVSSEASTRLGLAQLCEQFLNELWIPTHLTDEQALDFAVDYFKRTLHAELKLLDVRVAGTFERPKKP